MKTALPLIVALYTAIALPVLFLRSQETQNKIQAVQHHQNDALHSIICFVEFREKKTLPPKQRAQAIAFWAKALSDAHLEPCN